MTDTYTTTLTSGLVLTTNISADFGEVLIAGLVMTLLILLLADVLLRRVYGNN